MRLFILQPRHTQSQCSLSLTPHSPHTPHTHYSISHTHHTHTSLSLTAHSTLSHPPLTFFLVFLRHSLLVAVPLNRTPSLLSTLYHTTLHTHTTLSLTLSPHTHTEQRVHELHHSISLTLLTTTTLSLSHPLTTHTD